MLPETYIETAKFDCLHDEGIDYANKLRAHSVKISLYETKGTIHAFENTIESEITQSCIKRSKKNNVKTKIIRIDAIDSVEIINE